MDDSTQHRGAAAEAPGALGSDAPVESRPGVPMEAEPHTAEGAHWDAPPRQAGADRQLKRAGLDEPTAVVGTAQPPHGLSGRLRRQAYSIPEHHARHWMLLLLADRIDVLENRIGDALATPLHNAGFTVAGDCVRRDPLLVVAGVAMGAWLTVKLLR